MRQRNLSFKEREKETKNVTPELKQIEAKAIEIDDHGDGALDIAEDE
jgi:hypothetical protein